MYVGMGEGSLGMIDVRDIADSFVALLLNEGHENKIYTPTGPKSISFIDVAKTLSEDLSKSVTYVPVSIEAVGDAIIAAGWGDIITYDVETVTGKKARNSSQFANEMLAPAMT